MNRFLTILSILTVSAGLAVAPAADDTGTWTLALDMSAAKTGETGALLSEIAQRERVARKLAALEAMTGFAPLRDLDRVLITGQGPDETTVVLTAWGRFDSQRLIALIGAAQGYRIEPGSPEVHSWIDEDKGHRVYGGFVGEALFIGQSLDRIHAAMVSAQASEYWPMADGETAMMLVSASGMAHWAQRPNAAFLRSVNGGQMRIAERSGALHCTLTVDAATAESATQITQLMQGGHALAMLQWQNMQAQGEDHGPVQAALLTSFVVTQGETTITASASVPIDAVRTAVEAKADLADALFGGEAQ